MASSITTMTAWKIALTQLVLSALLGVIGINGKPPSAILNGDQVDYNEFPSLVSLRLYGVHRCGGSIIDSRHIVTAAHCIDNVYDPIEYMTVTAGTKYVNDRYGDDYRIKNITIHPEFFNSKTDPWRNDIAVITLSSAIKLNHRQRAVKLPTSDTPADTRVTVCGWGLTSYPDGNAPGSLRKLSLVVVPNSECRPPHITYIRETHMCAYSEKGAGVCAGDSGGPLLDDETLVGITSFMIPCGKGYPDVFTRVYSYVDWINEVTTMD